MTDPNIVKPRKFSVKKVIYDVNGFSIAFGEWDGHRTCLGMRWNGDTDAAGFPSVFGNPQWFMVSQEFTIPILKVIGIDISELETKV